MLPNIDEIKARRARLGYVVTRPVVSADLVNNRVDQKVTKIIEEIKKQKQVLLKEIEREKNEIISLKKQLERLEEKRKINIRVKQIIKIVCDYYRVSHDDIISSRRTNKIVIPRHVIFWAAKEFTGNSYPQIASRVGGRDHTTVLHGVRKINKLIAEGGDVAKDCEEIRAIIQNFGSHGE